MVDSIGDAICRGEPFFRLLLVMVSFLFTLFLVSLSAIERGTPEFYVSVANFFVLLTTLTAVAGLLYYCRRRQDS